MGCVSVRLNAQTNDMYVLALQACMTCLVSSAAFCSNQEPCFPLQVYLDLDFTLMEMNREPGWGGKQAGGRAVWGSSCRDHRLAVSLHPPGACRT